jgi:uncharacterized membrane protein YeiH
MLGTASLLELFETLGVGVFAMSGALAAGRKRLDLIGVFVVAGETAYVGGTVPDSVLWRQAKCRSDEPG